MNKIFLKDIHTLSVAKLASVLQGTIEGATEIRGLAIFQAIPSIGAQTAKNMLDRATFR
ncbi:hypothetical protein [Halalkalibacterium ligniniphilum]|uniref:hypothetical protein n=1 Tax=Halalkalibacterium ligniniphilum TaxID=1134413 RepID=UPI001375A15D|nr:hypothetical protein [Halalkalibacterium ligniniphilum]